ncbi:MAG: VanZ family protein [Clostridiales bacterium]|nr:VanZ family protein [Clostridiales bacterium]
MKIKILSWVLVVFWMGLIFYFSHQPATESSELSSGITEAIVDVINIIAPDNDLMSSKQSLNFIIRKAAHFGVYLVLGLLLSNGLIYSGVSKHKAIFMALLICILYAISDEFHQLYVTGRSGQVSDVLLDSAGSLVGILLMNAIRRYKGA